MNPRIEFPSKSGPTQRALTVEWLMVRFESVQTILIRKFENTTNAIIEKSLRVYYQRPTCKTFYAHKSGSYTKNKKKHLQSLDLLRFKDLKNNIQNFI